MNEKVVSERCIGYQKDADSITASVFEQILENGKKQWCIVTYDRRGNNTPFPALDIKPRIDIFETRTAYEEKHVK